MRKWWNWQTHHLEGVAPKGVGVQIPPSAPRIVEERPGRALMLSHECVAREVFVGQIP